MGSIPLSPECRVQGWGRRGRRLERRQPGPGRCSPAAAPSRDGTESSNTLHHLLGACRLWTPSEPTPGARDPSPSTRAGAGGGEVLIWAVAQSDSVCREGTWLRAGTLQVTDSGARSWAEIFPFHARAETVLEMNQGTGERAWLLLPLLLFFNLEQTQGETNYTSVPPRDSF